MPDLPRREFIVQGSAAALAGMAGLDGSHTAYAFTIDELVAAAKTEGQLTVIALPRDWCGYGGIIDGFKAKFGLTINELSPHAGSATVIDAIRKTRDAADPPTPDVIDVGLSFVTSAKKEGLLQPHKVATGATIPHAAKDAEGHWYGAYYGAIVFEVNADIVAKMPTDWADLAAPEYRNSVGLAGDLASNQAIQSVFAAGLSAANGNVAQAAAHGLKFFADLRRRGNFVAMVGDLASLTDGRTPILVRWDHLALGDRERLKGKTRIEIVRPRTSVAGVYAQAISASAAHPNAARLWMEYLYSDETQIAFLNGHCHPIRSANMVRNGKAPAESEKRLTQFQGSGTEAKPLFPTLKEQERAREIITNGWDSVVGVDIQCPPDSTPSGIPMSFDGGNVSTIAKV